MDVFELAESFPQDIPKKHEVANLKTEVTRKQKTPNFPKKQTFLTPDTHTYLKISI